MDVSGYGSRVDNAGTIRTIQGLNGETYGSRRVVTRDLWERMKKAFVGKAARTARAAIAEVNMVD